MPSEICSAFLYAQLEQMDSISDRRREIYLNYRRALKPLEAEGLLQLPHIPEDCQSNYHLFFVLVPNAELRCEVLDRMRNAGIRAVFHYVPLHKSPKGLELCGETSLPLTEALSERLIRLPFYHDMTEAEQENVISTISDALRSPSRRQMEPAVSVAKREPSKESLTS